MLRSGTGNGLWKGQDSPPSMVVFNLMKLRPLQPMIKISLVKVLCIEDSLVESSGWYSQTLEIVYS